MDWVKENQDRFRTRGLFDGCELWRFDGVVTISLPGPIHPEAKLVAVVVSQYRTDQEFTTIIGHAMEPELSYILEEVQPPQPGGSN